MVSATQCLRAAAAQATGGTISLKRRGAVDAHETSETVGPELDLREAAELMREHHVGFLIVVPTQARTPRTPIGALTDRDIVVSVVARRADPSTLRVADVMSAQPVVAGELVGVLSLDDLLDLIAAEIESLAGAVRHERQIEGVLRN